PSSHVELTSRQREDGTWYVEIIRLAIVCEHVRRRLAVNSKSGDTRSPHEASCPSIASCFRQGRRMCAFRPIPPLEFARLIQLSGQLAPAVFPIVRLAAPPPRGRRRIAARAVVRTTIALLVLTIGVTAGPFSFAQSRSVDPSRQEIGA